MGGCSPPFVAHAPVSLLVHLSSRAVAPLFLFFALSFAMPNKRVREKKRKKKRRNEPVVMGKGKIAQLPSGRLLVHESALRVQVKKVMILCPMPHTTG